MIIISRGPLIGSLLARLSGAALACSCLAGPPASAADRSLGTFKQWQAMAFGDKGKGTCMMWSQPVKDEGKYERRGEIFTFVTHRPADGDFGRVTLEMGYPIKTGTRARVSVDDQRFELHAEGSTAWTDDPGDDRRLIAAMRAGKTMVVKGISSRGTDTRDTYSLIGFTAAKRAIDKACPH